MVKDLGTRFEGRVAEVARTLLTARPALEATAPFDRLLAEAVLSSPGFTLRGGTNEILRGIVARDLGSQMSYERELLIEAVLGVLGRSGRQQATELQ